MGRFAMSVWGLGLSASTWIWPLAATAAAGVLAACILLRDHLRLERHALRLASEVERLTVENRSLSDTSERGRTIARDARGLATPVNPPFADLVQGPASTVPGTADRPPRAASARAPLDHVQSRALGEKESAAARPLRVGREIPAAEAAGSGNGPGSNRWTDDGLRRTARTALSGMMGLTSLLIGTRLDTDQDLLVRRVRDLGDDAIACLDGRASPPAEADIATTPERPGPARVLLVEDDEINALIATQALERAGALVEWVQDGRDAVEAARAYFEGIADRYDFVLMDLRMPGMDGLEAARRIRAMEDALQRTEPLRIVALTATTMRQDRLAAQAAGIDEFLCKPYRTETLVALLAPSGHRLQA